MGLLFATSPLLIVSLGALLLMLAEAFSKKSNEGDLALGTAVTLLAGAATAIAVWMVGPESIEGAAALKPYLLTDRFAMFFDFVICLGGAMTALLAGGYLPEHGLERGEFYPLIMFSSVGAMILAGSGDLLSLFIGLETMSIGVYAMTGFRRGSRRSVEAAMKYFLLGSFAAAVLLYGGALLYGATGHTDLVGIGQRIASAATAKGGGGVSLPLVIVGLMLVLVGLVFKVSAVPFHMWTPDAYEGAPTPATTFMAVAVKSAAFAMMLRVLLIAFNDPGSASWGAGWPPVIAGLAVLTMTVANVIAGRQESVKRMLAYSSIAHAGYVLIGVAATIRQNEHEAEGAILFYLLAYTVSTAGAFGALILCGRQGAEATSYEDLAGIGRRHPGAALPFALFLLSLAGVPPAAGFFGKFYIFRAAIYGGGGFYWLAVIGLLNSVVGAYYYLRVIVYMYMREPAPGAPIAVPMRSGYVAFALLACALLVLGLGLFPGSMLDIALHAPVHG
ncbi:MAG TPA: NADH-quinone oxidoreductase subunit N [Polyangiaceae bacterium]|jgi:NADH-quinone oxidoreductase subunit N|nr:NADH-quinone oxidoreductase subunit N [Polyangiaceae bacterium]